MCPLTRISNYSTITVLLKHAEVVDNAWMTRWIDQHRFVHSRKRSNVFGDARFLIFPKCNKICPILITFSHISPKFCPKKFLDPSFYDAAFSFVKTKRSNTNLNEIQRQLFYKNHKDNGNRTLYLRVWYLIAALPHVQINVIILKPALHTSGVECSVCFFYYRSLLLVRAGFYER